MVAIVTVEQRTRPRGMQVGLAPPHYKSIYRIELDDETCGNHAIILAQDAGQLPIYEEVFEFKNPSGVVLFRDESCFAYDFDPRDVGSSREADYRKHWDVEVTWRPPDSTQTPNQGDGDQAPWNRQPRGRWNFVTEPQEVIRAWLITGDGVPIGENATTPSKLRNTLGTAYPEKYYIEDVVGQYVIRHASTNQAFAFTLNQAYRKTVNDGVIVLGGASIPKHQARYRICRQAEQSFWQGSPYWMHEIEIDVGNAPFYTTIRNQGLVVKNPDGVVGPPYAGLADGQFHSPPYDLNGDGTWLRPTTNDATNAAVPTDDWLFPTPTDYSIFED